MKHISFFRVLCTLLCTTPVFAQTSLQLADIFGEGMVLQQKGQNNIWGQAQPAVPIYVQIQNKKATTESEVDGSWKVHLKGLVAGGPFALKVRTGNDSLVVNEVYVGEVWLASGQSNMERRLSASENGEEVAASARNTNIRFLMVPQINYEGEPISRELKWQTAVAPQVAKMSAIGYYFAKDLQEKLNVPVGIICAYKGGVPAEAWVSEETLSDNEKLRPILDRYRATAITDDKLYDEKMDGYKKRFRLYNDSIAKGYRNISRPFEPVGPKHHKRPCGLYHTMLERVMPYSVKGVIWYQGEGNAERGEQYKTLFPALIDEWRKDFEQPKLPFYYVQLTNYDHPFWRQDPYWAELREAQLYTWRTVKSTAMVVSIDKGDRNNLHPIFKKPIGERLASCALHLVYGKNVPYSGPVYRKAKIKGNRVVVSFDFVYSGLDSKGEDLLGFTVCGADHKFVPAKAEIRSNEVIVFSEKVDKPVAVRYGWSNWTEANLFNKEGLPASPFRTDNFPMLSDGVYYPVKIR